MVDNTRQERFSVMVLARLEPKTKISTFAQTNQNQPTQTKNPTHDFLTAESGADQKTSMADFLKPVDEGKLTAAPPTLPHAVEDQEDQARSDHCAFLDPNSNSG